MAAPLLTLRDVSLTFGGEPMLQSAEMMVHEGERLCLVGRNGSGKSPLFETGAASCRPTPASASPSPAPSSATCL